MDDIKKEMNDCDVVETVDSVYFTSIDDADEVLKYSKNRELSWLNFNRRVLFESMDYTTPRFEALKFIAIFQSNLEEFFRVRVGSLTDLLNYPKEIRDSKTNMTVKEQLDAIYEETAKLLFEKDKLFNIVSGELLSAGVVELKYEDLEKEEKNYVKQFYKDLVEPILSPQVISSRHPFPFLDNDITHILLEFKENKESKIGIIRIPERTRNFLIIERNDGKLYYIRKETIISHFAPKIFKNFEVLNSYFVNIYRNADINVEEYYADMEENVDEEVEYPKFMKEMLKLRTRLQAVVVQTDKPLSDDLRDLLKSNLSLDDNQFLITTSPTNLDYVFELEDLVEDKGFNNLLYKPFSPQPSLMVNPKETMIDQALKRDIALIYPYEDINHFIDLLNQAAEDPRVETIKITIYRLAKNSKIVRALVKALENGKEVTAFMELQARFDEESNINYSDYLAEAGCKIVYGVAGYKVHSKVCQITLREDEKLKYITQIGTGNYNEKTSRQYTDISLITSNEDIASDVQRFFNNLSLGITDNEYDYLLVSPNGFKSALMDLIDKEIAKGKDGRLFFKFNSFTDKELMAKLTEASKAGVKTRLIVRGISCMRPNIEGYTDNIEIRSVVGRFLEHPRVFIFGEGEDAKYFIGSADLMTRNTEKRVEVTTPIFDKEAKEKLNHYMELQWKDNIKARCMNNLGEYEEIKDSERSSKLDSQAKMMEIAEKDASGIELKYAREAKRTRDKEKSREREKEKRKREKSDEEVIARVEEKRAERAERREKEGGFFKRLLSFFKK